MTSVMQCRSPWTNQTRFAGLREATNLGTGCSTFNVKTNSSSSSPTLHPFHPPNDALLVRRSLLFSKHCHHFHIGSNLPLAFPIAPAMRHVRYPFLRSTG